MGRRRLPFLAIACAATLFGFACWGSAPTGSAQPGRLVYLPLDGFYTPPAAVPPVPGALVRSEKLTDRVLPPGSQAWRMMYTTTLPDGSPATAVATVLAPLVPPPGPRPVIMWEHGTAGVEQRCMPSTVNRPFSGVPALDAVVQNGWVLVATDYAANNQGVHPYLIEDGESRSAVDAVRAARQMPELTLDSRTVAWGHSQGGQAALASGIFGPGYAPDVNLSGVAALAPASDMAQIMAMHGGDPMAERLGAYLAAAFSQYYPDVQLDRIVPGNAQAIARRLAGLCLFDPDALPALNDLAAQLHGHPVLDPTSGTMGERLAQNAPTAVINAPVVVVQGLADEVVYPSVNDAFVDQQCAAGQALDYWRVPGRDHGGIVAPDSPITGALVAWTQDRLAGTPVSGCRRSTIG